MLYSSLSYGLIYLFTQTHTDTDRHAYTYITYGLEGVFTVSIDFWLHIICISLSKNIDRYISDIFVFSHRHPLTSFHKKLPSLSLGFTQLSKGPFFIKSY